jgi:DNA-binding HxlR family transcriptional regulator
MNSPSVKKSQGAPCPITTVARLLSDTWTMLIIHTFIEHPETTHATSTGHTSSVTLRFCELERALPGISTRTLTNKLKLIESEGLIKKTDTGYQATKKGLGIKLIEDAMRAYEKKYL